jgi:chromosome partitioning protein
MEGLAQVLELVKRAESSGDREILLEGLVLTLFSPEVDLCHEVAEEVKRYFPDDTLETPILRDPALAESASHGKPICNYQPRSAGAWSYLNLAKEVLEHEWTEAGTRA